MIFFLDTTVFRNGFKKIYAECKLARYKIGPYIVPVLNAL